MPSIGKTVCYGVEGFDGCIDVLVVNVYHHCRLLDLQWKPLPTLFDEKKEGVLSNFTRASNGMSKTAKPLLTWRHCGLGSFSRQSSFFFWCMNVYAREIPSKVVWGAYYAESPG